VIPLRVAVLVALALAAAGRGPSAAVERGLLPDPFLLLALGAGLFGSAGTAVGAGVAAGLAGGLLSVEPWGLDGALLGAVALAAHRIRPFFRADHPGVQGVLAFLAVLLLGGVRLALLALPGTVAAAAGSLPAVLASALATAAAAPVLLFVLDGIGAFRGPRAPEGRLSLV
jgi:cell shape-determining protein MreD